MVQIIPDKLPNNVSPYNPQFVDRRPSKGEMISVSAIHGVLFAAALYVAYESVYITAIAAVGVGVVAFWARRLVDRRRSAEEQRWV